MINASSTIFASTSDHVSEETVEQNIPPNSIQTLYHAAQVIKVDIALCKGINMTPLDNDDLTLHKSKEIIPQSLYWILRWIVTTAEHEVEAFGNHSSSCKNEADERHILMIAQDIIHSASHGRQKMPKQIGLGMTLRHLKGSKQITTLLNRIGHCSSYDDVEVADTSLALEVIAQSEDKDAVLPSNIVPGIFVHTAADNNDINEQTFDGRQTTHSPTLVLYQEGQFGSKPKSTVYADHSATKKALSDSDYPHVIKRIYHSWKKAISS